MSLSIIQFISWYFLLYSNSNLLVFSQFFNFLAEAEFIITTIITIVIVITITIAIAVTITIAATITTATAVSTIKTAPTAKSVTFYPVVVATTIIVPFIPIIAVIIAIITVTLTVLMLVITKAAVTIIIKDQSYYKTSQPGTSSTLFASTYFLDSPSFIVHQYTNDYYY